MNSADPNPLPAAGGEAAREVCAVPSALARRCEDLPREIWAAIDRIVEAIHGHRTFQVITHLRPDGDALGSALALHLILSGLGKTSRVYTAGPIPHMFDFLPGLADLSTEFDESYEPDVTIYVDCGDMARADSRDLRRGLTIDIDHHLGNPNFGEINYVDPTSPAAGEQVFLIAQRGGFALTPDIATCIYTAIISDTGNFQFGNTAPHVFEIATACAMAGVRPSEVCSLVFERSLPGEIILTGRVYSRLRFEFGGRLVWGEIMQSDYADVGGEENEPDGLSGKLRGIKGVDLAILIHELPGGEGLRASFRSRDAVDCQKIAASIGGGGHRQASGCVIRKPYAEAREELLRAARRAFQ